MRIFRIIIATLTNHPRQKVTAGVDFVWQKDVWTYNIFRLWEIVAGRRAGIRPEMSTTRTREGKVYAYFHTYESAIVHAEGIFRIFLKSFKLAPFRIYIPVLYTPQGFPIPTSPYLFAIAVDDANKSHGNQTVTNSLSWNHTVSGSNTILAAAGQINATSGTLSSFTYNGVATTSVNFVDWPGSTVGSSCLRYLIAPAAGTNAVVIGLGSSVPVDGHAVTYSGAKQSAQPDSSNTYSSNGSAHAVLSTTVVATGCWLVAHLASSSGGAVTPDSGTTEREVNWAWADGILDSNGIVSTGSQSLGITQPGSPFYRGIIMSIAPVPGTDYPLTAAAGSFTLTGIAILFRRASKVVATVASFTLTGVAAGLARGKGFAASVASFVFTGIDATLRSSGWVERSKPSDPTWSERSKPSSSWSERSKPSDPVWSDRAKPASPTWADRSKPSAPTWTEREK